MMRLKHFYKTAMTTADDDLQEPVIAVSLLH